MNKPAAYLTNLGMYNEGCLHGKWIDLPISEDDFQQALKDIDVGPGEYEEYFVSDYEDVYFLDMYCNREEMNKAAEISKVLNERLKESFGNDFKYYSSDVCDARTGLKDYVLELLDENYVQEAVSEKLKQVKIFTETHDPYLSCLQNFGYYLLEELDFLEYSTLSDEIKQNLDVEKFARNQLHSYPIVHISKFGGTQIPKVIIVKY